MSIQARLDGSDYMSARIVEIAGIDGSGKSTLAALMSERHGKCLKLEVSTPPAQDWFRSESTVLERTGRCSMPLETMYRAALQARYETNHRLRTADVCAILDRHVISLTAYYSMLGVRVSEILRTEFAQALPNRLILMDEHPALCHKRILARGRTLAYHELDESRLALYRRHILTSLGETGVPHLKATAPYSVDDLAEWCLSELRESA